MTLQEAIQARHSVRAYKEQPLTEDVVKVLGVEAALLAPTAVNQQKFSFEHIGARNNRHQIRG